MSSWIGMMRNVLHIVEVLVMQLAEAPQQTGHDNKENEGYCYIHCFSFKCFKFKFSAKLTNFFWLNKRFLSFFTNFADIILQALPQSCFGIQFDTHSDNWSKKNYEAMAYGKWIGGFLGWMAAGPLGALAGFALGSFFDSALSQGEGNEDPSGQGGRYTNSGTYGNGGRYANSGAYGSYTAQERQEEQRNSFRFSLLVLASYIIRADGKVMHSEMNVVRQWLRSNFGEAAVQQGQDIMVRLFEEQKRLGMAEFRTAVIDSCHQLSQFMPYEHRIQLLHFLVIIAQADGVVVHEEVNALRECALNLGLTDADLDGMLNLRDAGSSLDAAYKVLGVSPSATDEEVKAAYRQLALKNHPDRVATLGEDVRKAAEKKFQEINAAKETIWKARGL